jgi:CheY-like chemotaxis protein
MLRSFSEARQQTVSAACNSEHAATEWALPVSCGSTSGQSAKPAMRVLVVEDDACVREHTLRLIRGLGHIVRHACDGTDALRVLSSDPRCDILFSDIVMPGMSGGQLALAARLMVPQIAIVFVTGYHSDPHAERLNREGTASVLSKPYRRVAVETALQRAIQNR